MFIHFSSIKSTMHATSTSSFFTSPRPISKMSAPNPSGFPSTMGYTLVPLFMFPLPYAAAFVNTAPQSPRLSPSGLSPLGLSPIGNMQNSPASARPLPPAPPPSPHLRLPNTAASALNKNISPGPAMSMNSPSMSLARTTQSMHMQQGGSPYRAQSDTSRLRPRTSAGSSIVTYDKRRTRHRVDYYKGRDYVEGWREGVQDATDAFFSRFSSMRLCDDVSEHRGGDCNCFRRRR